MPSERSIVRNRAEQPPSALGAWPGASNTELEQGRPLLWSI